MRKQGRTMDSGTGIRNRRTPTATHETRQNKSSKASAWTSLLPVLPCLGEVLGQLPRETPSERLPQEGLLIVTFLSSTMIIIIAEFTWKPAAMAAFRSVTIEPHDAVHLICGL
mmetsp:Transcript_28299/g.71082  ORF Transcript_28299/g.71082 Transcript_28299/m.71082 type:complete len:113 (+) Transcript_28299:345-683(+)